MNRRQLLIGGGILAAGAAGAAAGGLRQIGSSSTYDQAGQAIRATMAAQPATRDLVRYATLAPNSHNTQAWRFAVAPGNITILPDFTRRTPAVDPDNHHLYVSLGCAAENLTLAAAASGRSGEAEFNDRDAGAVVFSHHQ